MLQKFWKTILPTAGIYAVLLLMIDHSGELSSGIRTGIQISLELVIPSMFLFLILSGIIANSRLRELLARPFAKLGEWIFGMAPAEFSLVLLSLLGGYPIGAKLLSDSVRQGRLKKKQAEWMLCYSVNCGPAFLVSGVGVLIFGNWQAGIFLYLSQIAACLALGFFHSFGIRRMPKASRPASCFSRLDSGLLVSAVTDSVRTMGIICGFVLLFSGISPLLIQWAEKWLPDLAPFLPGILEVTSGCQSIPRLSSGDPLLLAAAYTAFGGICVLLQLMALLRPSGIRMTRFLLFRIPYLAISVGVTAILQKLFPQTLNCIRLNRQISPETYSVSPPATFFLILLAVMLLFFHKKSATIGANRK